MQVELYEPQLGTLALGCEPYVVTSVQIGSPAVREVVRNRSLADGTFDDTRYLGPRAITVAIRFNDVVGACDAAGSDMQDLIDRLTPYMSPKRRPTLTWQLPRSTKLRAAVVRGANWDFTLAGPKAQVIAPQWVVPSGEILAGGPDAQICVTIRRSTDVEVGRIYDLTFDRVYVPSDPVGARNIVNPGTKDTHWVLTIFGPVINPEFTINGIKVTTDQRGGVTLLVGQTLVIDSRARTVLYNGVAGESAYQHLNFDEWGWDDLMLHPGVNTARFDGTEMSAQTAAEMCFTPSYL